MPFPSPRGSRKFSCARGPALRGRDPVTSAPCETRQIRSGLERLGGRAGVETSLALHRSHGRPRNAMLRASEACAAVVTTRSPPGRFAARGRIEVFARLTWGAGGGECAAKPDRWCHFPIWRFHGPDPIAALLASVGKCLREMAGATSTKGDSGQLPDDHSFTTPFDPHQREVSTLQLQPGSRVLHIRFALMPICAPPNLEFVFAGRREAGSAASAISPRSVFGCYGIKAVESGFSPVAVSTGYAGRRPGARSLAGWRGRLHVSPVRPPCRNDRLRRRLRQGWRAALVRVRR